MQVLVGVAGLILGASIYLIGRPPDQTYFVSKILYLSFYQKFLDLFGMIGNNLPDLLHVFSFILITAGLLTSKKIGYAIICSGWFLIDATFELGQRYSYWTAAMIPEWFDGIPFFENTKSYFLQGTFDAIDITAIFLGTLVAYFVLLAAECLINGIVVAQNNNVTGFGDLSADGPDVYSGDAVQIRCSSGYLVDGSSIAIWHYGDCDGQVIFDSNAIP